MNKFVIKKTTVWGDHYKVGAKKKIRLMEKLAKTKIIVITNKNKIFRDNLDTIVSLLEICFKPDIYFKPILKYYGAKWVLAMIGREIVGLCCIHGGNIIDDMCVSPKYRRKKIGSKILKAAVEYICKNNQSAKLGIFWGNVPKHLTRYYVKNNFKPKESKILFFKKTEFTFDCGKS